MSAAHTPGPWAVDGDDTLENGNFVGVYVAKAGDGRIGQTFSNCLVTSDDECRANARLIAVAPDLLEMLRVSVTLLKKVTPSGDAASDELLTLTIEVSELAIAKAEGGAL